MKNKHTKEEITRKEALARMGKYAALTAAGTFLILNPAAAQTQSFLPGPEGGFNNGANKSEKGQQTFPGKSEKINNGKKEQQQYSRGTDIWNK
ncbi:hypothetical protein [uncultured Gelidibacter sp.]|uniref:hypothetical protein n=1 Tax=uncultured Gelidibacter sp. TaxID=259318 RepID=UPI00260B72C9|nr:hypothetical protein [uncultured Gelidibacter sp.]